MTTPNNPQQTITELLAELEAAIRNNNRVRAVQLQQTILQRLATETADREALERRVRELMQRLAQVPRVPTVEPFDNVLERGGASPDEAGVVYPVWFGTNRQPQGNGFTGARHDRITRGRIDVFVPEAHRFGETGTPFWKRLLRRDLRGDWLEIQQRARLEQAAFYADLQQRLDEARAGGEETHALFFLHGFNVTFDDAAIRAAQIGFDLKAHATAFFSWPSRGSVAAYPADEASLEASERHITDFLIEFVANCHADKTHVIAHSMGNRGLLRALQRIAANAHTQGKVKFGQIFLAAPDVDRDLFLDLARMYPQFAERTTLYTSDGDLPVHLSAKLHDAPRAGYFAPYTVAPGVDTVAVPDFDVDLLGHSYFAQAEALLHDIFDLMRHNQAPSARQRITPDLHDGATFWKLRR